MTKRVRRSLRGDAARRFGAAAVIAGAACGPDAIAAPPTQNEQAATGETVIVTGTRNINRKARDSTSPIQVVSSAAIRRTGSPNLADALVHVNPSFDSRRMGEDTAALTASIRLRGLGPNETLVLLDGIRRHPTSNIVADAGPEQGSTPADLNMIAPASIDHIEVLQDGAAAQYGSDAIAGVINIITKKTDHGGSASVQTGANANNGDGWMYQLDADKGASFGKDGYIHIAGQIYHKDFYVQPAVDDRAAAQGFPSNSNKILGLPEETRELLNIDQGATIVPDLWGGLQEFTQITYGHRHSEAYENFRSPSSSNNILAIYPGGFSPRETDEENDFAATLGLKADDVYGWHVNVSTTYGEDDTDVGNKDTLNPNLYNGDFTPGDPNFGSVGFSPTTVLAQTQQTSQWTNDINVVRPVTVAHMPLNIAFGAEHRLDMYQLGAGNPPSWEDGGTQGFAGLRPQNAGSWSRDVYGIYGELDIHPVPAWDIDFAGRFEHYTDFGNAEIGKISSRYDITRWVAVRGTISNGFEAPTLAEEHYSALNVSPTGASGDLAVDSQAARDIGAVPLKPERSTNVSGGIVLQPMRNVSVTADFYQINLRDRIVAAGGETGQPALNAIEATGASIPAGAQLDDISAYYFANGISTRTQGVDIQAAYLSNFDRWGTVDWTLGIDLNRTRLHHMGTDTFGNNFLTLEGVGWYTKEYPRSKIIGDALWRIGKWDVNVRETRWGSTVGDIEYQDLAPAAIQYNGNTPYQFENTPAWTTDLEIGYQLTEKLHAAVGGLNVFNLQPRRQPADASYLNVQYFDINSAGLPMGGGFYYGRLTYAF